jgi:rhodanese-related sulfurtransferase
MLVGAGFKHVYTISGGHISLQRYALAVGFTKLRIALLPVESKSLVKEKINEEEKSQAAKKDISVKSNEPIIIDVRTPQEFRTGAFPGAVNIPLDTLPHRLSEVGDLTREIVVYCASGARSSYAMQFLNQNGYTRVRNGGGIMQMMRNR